MAQHLEAVAAQEHRADASTLAAMCAAVHAWLDPPVSCGAIRTGSEGSRGPDARDDHGGPDDLTGVAAVVRGELAALRLDIEGDRVDRESARLRLRRLVALAAATRGCDHAQSPVHDPRRDLAGGAESWDYRRDRHREGAEWERHWIAAVVGGSAGAADPDRGLSALLTSCGMAAVTTVVGLMERHTGTGPILVDSSTYHETRHLLATGALAARVQVVATHDLADAIEARRPTAVIVDAVSNTAEIRVPDLDRLSILLARAGRHLDPAPLLVVDCSVCSITAPAVQRLLRTSSADLPDGPTLRRRHRTVVIESLTKHAQLGLDRVAAGVIVSGGGDAPVLDCLREHLGTNVADLVCLQLLPPDRAMLRTRLRRVGRNAELLASRLAAAGVPVVHPSRPDHPDHDRWDRDRPSVGLLTIAEADAPPDLLDRWSDHARARGVAIDRGAGFGFDTTRIYRTSATVPEAEAFVRIAPGAEPVDRALAVADVLATAWPLP